MAVLLPVGAVDVHLYIPCPDCISDFDFCIAEVGTCIMIMHAKVNDLYRLSTDCLQVYHIEGLGLPEVVEQIFADYRSEHGIEFDGL